MSEFSEYIPNERGRRRNPVPDDLVIRPARSTDLDEIADIAAARERETREKWRPAIERAYTMSVDERAHLVVASVGGRVAGYGKSGYFSIPTGSPSNVAPEGWYLAGLVVRPEFRRQSLGSLLTLARLAWIAERSDSAYYFANARNKVSIELHRSLGFVVLTRDFTHPHATFEGGVGILFTRDLSVSINWGASWTACSQET